MVWRTIRLAALAVLGMGATISAANAMACGSDVRVTSGPVSGVFDPFSPVPVTFGSVTLTFTRAINSTGGGKTQNMAFYMQQPAGSPSGDQVVWPDTGQNILFTAGGPHPTINFPPTAAQPSGVALVNWGGAAQPDTITKTVSVTLDPGFNPAASETINFDLIFVCKGTGGFTDVSTPQTLVGVIQISIQVLSGLQASYAGPALDFGEIGQVSNAQASGHSVAGQFQVKSSGAFTVALSSGNHFLMTFPSGPSTSPNSGTVQYELGFGGQTMSFASQTFTTLSCHRVGVTAPVFLPVAAKLIEGGQGKTPAPNYQDMLSVTFTPLVDTATGSVNCQSLGDPTP